MLIPSLLAVLAVSGSALDLKPYYAEAAKHFSSHVYGTPTTDVVVKLPSSVKAEEVLALEELKKLLEKARAVEEGCAPKCDKPEDVAVYERKLLFVCSYFGITGADARQVVGRYIVKGVPRMKPSSSGVQSDADRMLEAAAVAALLANEKTSDEARLALNIKAEAIARALGKTAEIKADGDGFVTLASGARAKLTPEQIAALNRVPRSRATYLRKMADEPPTLKARESTESDAWLSDAYGFTIVAGGRTQAFRTREMMEKHIASLPADSITAITFYGHGMPGMQTVGDANYEAGSTSNLLKGKMAKDSVVNFTGCNTASIGGATLNPAAGISMLTRRLMYFSVPYLMDRTEANKEFLEREWDADLARDTSLRMRDIVICGYRTFGLAWDRMPGVTKLMGTQKATTPGHVSGTKVCYRNGVEVEAPRS